MAMDVARVCECLYHHGGDQTGIIERQVGQRLELARFWGIQPGWKILEVGCGEGITTVGLAAAVGFEGRVTAVDLDGSEEWEDPTLGELTQFVTNSWLGERIEFLLGLDLLTSAEEFDARFDAVVFNQCSWYMPNVQVLRDLFGRVRPWAERLAFHEWNPVPSTFNQVPHFLSTLIQARLKAMDTVGILGAAGNIWSLITPDEARKAAVDAGWRIEAELELVSSEAMEDGKSWEPGMAIHYGKQFLDTEDALPTEAARAQLERELSILESLAQDRRSLRSWAFTAI